MIYKFKSKAAGDLIFLPENARQILSILGKTEAAQGIIEPAAMAAAVQALQAAVAQAEQDQRQGEGQRGVLAGHCKCPLY